MLACSTDSCYHTNGETAEVVRKPVVLHFELYPLNPAAEFGG